MGNSLPSMDVKDYIPRNVKNIYNTVLYCHEEVRRYCSTGELPVRKLLMPPVKAKRKIHGFTDTLRVWNTVVERGKVEAPCPICENTMVLEVRKDVDDSTLGCWEISHILAHAEGGSDELSNLRPLCKKCNRAMGKMHMVEYIHQFVSPYRRSQVLRTLRLETCP
jgi:5-methylcytosine-specific restriction endonuclease McrA